MTTPAHDFVFPQLRTDAKPNYQPYVKLVFYFKKREDVSYEHFHRHWETVHADLATSAEAFAAYVSHYTQIHQTPELKDQARQFAGMELLEFDGCSEILVKSMEDGQKFFQSREYIEAMQKDEGNFLARPIHIMVGYENLIFGKGFAGGTDGISPADLKH